MIYKRVLLSKMISFQSLIRFKKITLVQINKILIQPNNKENIFNLEVFATFYPMKIINLQIFAKKISEENRIHARNFLENQVKENFLTTLSYNISFNSSYFSICKEPLDMLVIFSDETCIDDVIKNDFEKADKIMFWTESQNAKELLKKYPKKILLCKNKFDHLLTPRFFKI